MLNILILCFASMFTYVSKEMVYPIIPLYLTTLGLTPGFIGLIDGITKSIASIVKFYSGYFSDRKQQRKKYIVIGYLGMLLHKVFLFISASWIGVTVAKEIERLGKGIKMAPSDAIIAENIEHEKMGYAFGLLKCFDKFGAVIGIIISYLLIAKSITQDYKLIFFWSIIPTIIAISLLFFIKEDKNRGRINIDFKKIPSIIQFFVMFVFITAIGNSSKAFMLLKAQEIVGNPLHVISLYMVANLSSCLWSYPLGKFCDKLRVKYLLSLAYIIFGITYLGMGTVNHTLLVYLAFITYGFAISAFSIGTKVFLIVNVEPSMKATVLGANECLVGLSSLPASIIFSLLWSTFNSNIPFFFSATVSFVSAIALLVGLKYFGKEDRA